MPVGFRRVTNHPTLSGLRRQSPLVTAQDTGPKRECAGLAPVPLAVAGVADTSESSAGAAALMRPGSARPIGRRQAGLGLFPWRLAGLRGHEGERAGVFGPRLRAAPVTPAASSRLPHTAARPCGQENSASCRELLLNRKAERLGHRRGDSRSRFCQRFTSHSWAGALRFRRHGVCCPRLESAGVCPET